MSNQRKFHIHQVLNVHEQRLRNLESNNNDNNEEKYHQEFFSLKEEFHELKQSLESNKIKTTNSELEKNKNLQKFQETIKTNVSSLEKKFSNLDKKITELLVNTSNFCEQLLRLDAQNSVMNKRLETLEERQEDETDDNSEMVEEN